MDRHLIDAWISECEDQERRHREAEDYPKYTCDCCGERFNEGVEIDDYKFCLSCNTQNKPAIFFRDKCGLPICTIFNQILNTEKDL